jgi:uncharacterized protein DUF4386
MAGLFYFLASLVMIFGFLYVPRLFIVNGDAAATAQRILAGERMYRISVLASLVGQLLFIFAVLNLYELFRGVDRKLARMMAVLVLVAIAADLVVIANRMAPIDLLIGNKFLTVFTTPQREALSLGFLYLGGNLSLVLTMFWGLWLLPFGVLVIKSGFFPKALGAMLVIAGVGYVVTSIVSFVFPDQLKAIRGAMMPLYFGEVPIILWLLFVGAKVPESGVGAQEAAAR